MRNTSESILGKYAIPQKKGSKSSSDAEAKKMPLMAEYEQRYKGMVRSVTEPEPVQTLEEKMEEIRLVNRAKWALIKSCHMTEENAHRYIQKQAMDLCLSKKETAENILKTYG